MYLTKDETDALNNNLDVNTKRQFLRGICLVHDECDLCSIKEKCIEVCAQKTPKTCSDYQIHKLFEKVI